jgi:hypothetical protein
MGQADGTIQKRQVLVYFANAEERRFLPHIWNGASKPSYSCLSRGHIALTLPDMALFANTDKP